MISKQQERSILNMVAELSSGRSFLGGSRRFGYNTIMSDIDIFVNPIIDPAFYNLLVSLGFDVVPRMESNYLETASVHVTHYKTGDIDIIYYDSCPEGISEWETLRDEHQLVEDWCYENPEVVRFITSAKSNNLFVPKSGKVIYRTLLAYARAEIGG